MRAFKIVALVAVLLLSATLAVGAVVVGPDPDCKWIGETAWAGGDRYVAKGNWATYMPKDSTATLLAGRTMVAGSVTISGGMVTITLKDGWRFAATSENVKIQHYAAKPPAVNPAPGRFATKGTASESPFEIKVPDGKFYGVHVEVEWAKCDQ